MLSRFIFCSLLVGCLAVPHRFKRSINGTKAVHTEIIDNKLVEHPYAIDYPYMIEVLKNGYHQCGGVLIRPNIVLSASHCFGSGSSRTRASQCELLAGNQLYEDQKSPFVQVRQVEIIIHYPNFELYFYDAALLKATKPFDLNIHVNVVKVATEPYLKKYMGRKTVTLGWGATKTGYHSKYLMKVYGIVEECEYETCVGIRGLYGGIPRPGDSGGPTVIQGKERKDDLLIGVLSKAGDRYFLPVNLADISDWINDTLEELNI